MMRVQVYPVMDGMEVWIASSCSNGDPTHIDHRGDSVHRYISSETIDKVGVAGAVALEITVALHEFASLETGCRC